MFCTKCGKNNPDFGKFCYGCGTQLPESAKPAPPPVPVPRPVLVLPIPVQKTIPVKPAVPPPPKKAWSPFDPITTLEAAQKAARRGSVACFIVAGLTAVVAALIAGNPSAISDQALAQANPLPILLEGALVAYAGWQVRRQLSRGWAMTALGLYIVEAIFKFQGPDKNAAVVSLVIVFVLAEGVRGTFNYHRLMNEAYQAAAETAKTSQADEEELEGGALDWLVGRITLPPGAPQLMPRTVAESRRRRLLAVAAGLGCGFCLLTVLGTMSILEEHKATGFLVAAVLMLLATLTFVEPLVQYISKTLGLPSGHALEKEENKKRVQMAFLAISFVLVVLHNLIHETVDKDLTGSLLLLAITILIPGRVALAWLDGLREKPVRAMVKGGQRAFVMGALVMLFFWAATGGALPFPVDQNSGQAATPQLSSYQIAQPQEAPLEAANKLQLVSVPFNIAIFVALINGLQWAFLGIAGGFALEKQWGTRRMLGVMGALTGASFVTGILMNSLAKAPMETFFITLAQGAGWGVGLLLYPPAEKALRIPEASTVVAPASVLVTSEAPQDLPSETTPEETA